MGIKLYDNLLETSDGRILKIKRCPICNGKASFVTNSNSDNDWGIECENWCIYLYIQDKNPEELVNKWNSLSCSTQPSNCPMCNEMSAMIALDNNKWKIACGWCAYEMLPVEDINKAVEKWNSYEKLQKIDVLKPCPFCNSEAVEDEKYIRCPTGCVVVSKLSMTSTNGAKYEWQSMPDTLEKLIACPKCGGNNGYLLCDFYYSWRCCCADCTTSHEYCKKAEYAVEYWNTQAIAE